MIYFGKKRSQSEMLVQEAFSCHVSSYTSQTGMSLYDGGTTSLQGGIVPTTTTVSDDQRSQGTMSHSLIIRSVMTRSDASCGLPDVFTRGWRVGICSAHLCEVLVGLQIFTVDFEQHLCYLFQMISCTEDHVYMYSPAERVWQYNQGVNVIMPWKRSWD